jgi:hypothetical protein
MSVDSLSGRARLLVIAAFVLSAGLFGTAAVAYVVASRDDGPKKAGPTVHPSVIVPTQEPSATPTPTLEPTSSPTPAASPTASPSASPATSPSPSASPRAATSSPRPSPTRSFVKQGLFVDAVLDPADGDTVATVTDFVLSAHATDGDGTIKLQSVTWGDGTKSTSGKTSECPSTGTGDCKDFELHHVYNRTGRFEVYLTVTSGPTAEKQVLHISAFVNHPAPTPSPSAS